MKKKVLTMGLALICVLSLAACQKKKPIETDSIYKAQSTEESTKELTKKETEKKPETITHKFAISLENYDENESTPIIFRLDPHPKYTNKEFIYESPKPVKVSKSEDGKSTILDFEITSPRTHRNPSVLVPPVNKHNEPKTYHIQLDINDDETTTLHPSSWVRTADVYDIINQTKIAFENGCDSLSKEKKDEIMQKQQEYLQEYLKNAE